MGWLALSVAGLLFVAVALIWTGWFAASGTVPAGGLPQGLVPLLALPVVVAGVAYGVAVFRAWRRAPAVNAWLIGFAGHAIYLLAGAAASGMGLDEAATTDNFWTLLRIAAPGLLLLSIEWNQIEAAPRA